MFLLSKTVGGNQQLKGPNISKAEKCTVDLSGTKLILPVPEKTLIAPIQVQTSAFDIFDLDIYNRWESDHCKMSTLVHENGWKFTGKYRHSFGYVRLDVRLVRFESRDPAFTFSNSTNLKAWLLNYAEESWGQLNRSKTEEHKGAPPQKYLWTYPTNEEQLYDIESQEGGFYFFTSTPTRGIEKSYWIPISEHHLLEFEFITNPIDCDFYSPEHNLPEATEQFIQEFMRNVKITPSPEALVEKSAVDKTLYMTQTSQAST